MHATACLTADVHVIGLQAFLSLGVTAVNTQLTARKSLFRATGVSDAEHLAPQCSNKACRHRPRSPFAIGTQMTLQMGLQIVSGDAQHVRISSSTRTQ